MEEITYANEKQIMVEFRWDKNEEKVLLIKRERFTITKKFSIYKGFCTL